MVKADLDATVLYEKPDTNSVAGTTLTATITAPSAPCASCTLQLRQLMMGSAKPYYGSCAAIKIVPAGGTSATTAGAGGSGAGGAGGSGSNGQGGHTGSPAGAGGSDSTAAGPAKDPVTRKTGACSAAPTSDPTSPPGTGLLAVACAIILRARRRAR